MKEVSSGLRNLLLVIAIIAFVTGLVSMFAQSNLMMLYGVDVVSEPVSLRLVGVYLLGFAYLLFKAYKSSVVAVVDLIVKGTLLVEILLISAGLINYLYTDLYPLNAYIIFIGTHIFIFLALLIMYKKNM